MSATHYACMPLVANVPDPRPDWERTACPACGEPCWRLPQLALLPTLMPGTEVRAVCTRCALKKAGTL